MYHVERIEEEGCKVVVLKDEQHDAFIRVIVDIGCNVTRFRTGGRELLVPPRDLKQLRKMSAHFGYPVLFPPNRISGGRFEWRGRKYQFPLNADGVHHMHGELKDRPWRVVDFGSSSERGAWLTASFSIPEHADIYAYFPHKLRFTLTISLHEGKLYYEGTIANEGDDEVPLAAGLHPYFPVEPDDIVQIDVWREWPIQGAFVAGAPNVSDTAIQVGKGIRIHELPSEGYRLFELAPTSDRYHAAIHRPSNGTTIVYEMDASFRYLVLFKPSWSQAVSLEPYTCVTDAFNLDLPPEVTGARGIHPGQQYAFRFVLSSCLASEVKEA